MRQMSLRVLMLCLAPVLLTVSLSGCAPALSINDRLNTGDIKMEVMAPILRNDPVGAPLLDALQDYPNFFAKFRGGAHSDEFFDCMISQMRRRETARQAGTYEKELDKMIAEYRAKGWLNDERAVIYRKLYMIPGVATADNRSIIADTERLRDAQKYPKRFHRVVGLPETPALIQPYLIGISDELSVVDMLNPAQTNTAGLLWFALPIPPVQPGGATGADHIRRLLTTVFTAENGWKTETSETLMAEYKKLCDQVAALPPASRQQINLAEASPERRFNYNHIFVVTNMKLPAKQGLSGAEFTSITFEDLYDDLGFIWVQLSHSKTQPQKVL